MQSDKIASIFIYFDKNEFEPDRKAKINYWKDWYLWNIICIDLGSEDKKQEKNEKLLVFVNCYRKESVGKQRKIVGVYIIMIN